MWASYSRWDGSQAETFDADDVLEHLADELLNGERSLESALRRLLQHGAEFRSGRRAMGLRELLERMRGTRQQRQRQYNLASSLEEIRHKLDQVVETEREGIQRRLEQPEGEGWRGLLERLARDRLDQLDRLPDDLGGRLHGLRDYDFLDPEARQQFDELLNSLQQQLLDSTFRGLTQAIQSLTPEALRQIRDMVHDLNRLFDGGLDFAEFMRRWGHFFPEGIHDADQLAEHLRQQMAQLQGLLNAMSPEMRRQLEGLLDAVFRDQGLQAELSQLAATMRELFPDLGDIPGSSEFSGEEPVSLREALKLMGELDDFSQAEQRLLKAVQTNDASQVDSDQVGRLLGREAQQMTRQLQELTRMLRESGLIERGSRGWELTPQATRKIGEQALREIFGRLRESGLLGRHALERRGNGVDRLDETRRYAFGDPLSLDVQRTLRNALSRQGAGVPLRLTPDDFEVYDTEQLTTCSTLILLDMSMSMMGRRFQAGRKVALALDSLIRSRFPRDHLQVAAFSYFVLPLESQMLLQTGWIENGGGTNFQEALRQARLLLAPHKHGTRQVILITDGEPTTYYGRWHADDDDLDGLTETLREVARCTRERITINVFMMDRHQTPAESAFVRAMLRLNKGRAFFASADRLGEYVLLDYLADKRRALSLH